MTQQGRNTLCTKELTKEIASFIRLGNTNIDAATNAGISHGAFYKWLARGRVEQERIQDNPRAKIRKKEKIFVDFVEAVKEAIPQRKATLLARVQKAGKGGDEIVETRIKTALVDGVMVEVERNITRKHRPPEWQADAWLLERIHFNEYGRRQRVDVHDWRNELKELWLTGKLTKEDIRNELGSELAEQFFVEAGIIAVEDRASSSKGEDK